MLELVGTTVRIDWMPESYAELVSLLVDRLQAAGVTTLLDVSSDVLAQIAGVVLMLTLLFAFLYVLLRYERSFTAWFRQFSLEPNSPSEMYLKGVDRELGQMYVDSCSLFLW